MTLLNRLALVASLTAAVAMIPSASFADGVSRRAAATPGALQADLDGDLTIIRQELVLTQRTIREALLNATLTTDQMTEAFSLFENFTKNYAGAVETNDPMLSEFTLDELYEGKVAQPLQQKFGLRSGETDFLRIQLDQWVTGELVLRDSVRLQGGK